MVRSILELHGPVILKDPKSTDEGEHRSVVITITTDPVRSRPGSLRSRTGVVPLVIIVAIAAIAALFMLTRASYACFGCNGVNSHGVQVIACNHSGGELICELSATNSGTNNFNVTACQISLGGVSTVGTLGGNTAVRANSSATFTCTVRGTEPSGSPATGTVSFSDGVVDNFAGNWI